MSGTGGLRCWYVVQTKPRQETVAEENLLRQTFETYLPLVRQKRRLRGKWRSVVEPLFPRYLFMRADAANENLGVLRSTRGVTGLVRFGNVLKPVPDGVIADLKASEEGGECVLEPGRNVFSPGEAVMVLDGPFSGIKAIFQARNGEERAIILLDMLGQQNRVSVQVDNLGKAG